MRSMKTKFETTMSSKGQVVISKHIRTEMGLFPNQKFVEERRGIEIVFKPILPISKAKGFLRGIEKESTSAIIKEVKKGWD
ncbi:MAG: hypothetical protein AABX51_05375 [Nanoarchaeota archaeon]